MPPDDDGRPARSQAATKQVRHPARQRELVGVSVRETARRPKSCADCGEVFTPSASRQRYCDRCRAEDRARHRDTVRKRRRREDEPVWQEGPGRVRVSSRHDGTNPSAIADPQLADLRKRRPNYTDSAKSGVSPWPPADPWARAVYERNRRWGVTA
jgi:hypothetical protein